MNEPIATVVRRAIYSFVVQTGVVPDVRALESSTGIPAAGVESALEALAEAHVIVLADDRRTIRFAPPFAGIETRFRVSILDRTWSAPCAWDSFGIPAALRADADITTACAESGEPIACGVRGGHAYGSGIIHLLVPAARFWDDIVYT